MNVIEILLLALGLSMDAFAVSICKGLSVSKVKAKHMLIAGAWFGIFQALMPLIGYYISSTFNEYVEKYANWISFALLAIIGAKMVKDSFSKEEEKLDKSFGIRTMFFMAIATSIDAMAVGVTFAMLPDINLVLAVSVIGIITFILSAIGVKLGSIFGDKYKSRAELLGGIILIVLGLKIILFP